MLDEIVHQFADSYAFVRELVQNAIDAGAKSVRIAVDEGPDVVHTSFEDDGSGMTLETLEGPLLTAFSSAKEGQDGKIGRYGVGFLSVFALDPERVVVSTRCGESAYEVTISPDRSYAIEERPAAPGSGTTVTLVSRIPPDEVRAHAERVARAATTWCRHVAIELTLSIDGGERRALARPFSIDSPVVVRGERDGARAVVGARLARSSAAPDGEAAGFYHSGLLLFETGASPPALEHVAFKVESSRFSHTISRDGVRKDRTYASALSLVEDLVERDWPAALEAELRAADDREAVDEASFARHAEILRIAFDVIDRKKLPLVLASPRPGQRCISLADAVAAARAGKLSSAFEGSPLAELATLQGHAVVRLDREGIVDEVLRRALRLPLLPVSEAVTALFIEDDERRAELARSVGDALRSLGKKIAAVRCVRAEGRELGRATSFVRPDSATTTPSGPRGYLAGPAGPARGELLIVVNARPVAAALRAKDRVGAAALVARLALLEAEGTPSECVNLGLLDWAARAREAAR